MTCPVLHLVWSLLSHESTFIIFFLRYLILRIAKIPSSVSLHYGIIHTYLCQHPPHACRNSQNSEGSLGPAANSGPSFCLITVWRRMLSPILASQGIVWWSPPSTPDHMLPSFLFRLSVLVSSGKISSFLSFVGCLFLCCNTTFMFCGLDVKRWWRQVVICNRDVRENLWLQLLLGSRRLNASLVLSLSYVLT